MSFQSCNCQEVDCRRWSCYCCCCCCCCTNPVVCWCWDEPLNAPCLPAPRLFQGCGSWSELVTYGHLTWVASRADVRLVLSRGNFVGGVADRHQQGLEKVTTMGTVSVSGPNYGVCRRHRMQLCVCVFASAGAGMLSYFLE